MARKPLTSPQIPMIGSYEAWVCQQDHCHVVVNDGEHVVSMVMSADDLYDMAQSFLRVYDEAAGIGPPGPTET